MKILSIYKDKVLTNQLTYASDEELKKDFEYHQSIGSFGEKYDIEITDNSAELAAHEEACAKKKVAKEKILAFDKSKVTTVAALKEFVADIVELLK